MKKILLIFILLIISTVAFCADNQEKPMLLIYPGDLLESASADDQMIFLENFKTYLSRSQQVESIVYTLEMPSVLLAVKEGKLTGEQIALSAPLSDKINVGKKLGYDYLVLPELKRDSKTFDINVNIYDLKNDKLNSYGASLPADNKNLLNNMNSAVSGITFKLLRDITNETPDFGGKNNKKENKEEKVDLSSLSSKDLLKLGKDEEKKENYTQAILYITKAIDKSPDDPELRLELANAYFMKQMYKEALDQYYNAVNMGYRGNDLNKLKQKYESRVRASDYVKPAEEINKPIEEDEFIVSPPQLDDPSNEFNKQIEDLLAQGDAYWKKNNSTDALKIYAQTIKKFPNDYRAYERIAILYANNKNFAECASVLRTIEKKRIDYDTGIVTRRVNTISAIITAYYLGSIKNLKNIKEDIMYVSNTKELDSKLKNISEKIYESIDLANVLASQSNSFYVTNINLTGNLINSAVSGLIDYLEAGDLEGIDSAEGFLNQAEIRIAQLKY